MTFVSYAQNCEDVMLHRAFKDTEKGFYVDVGAHDPVEDSVTKAFYERGWRGINIEPVSSWFHKLARERPEDVNLQLAIASQPGYRRFFEVKDTGLSTLDESIARHHEKGGYTVRSFDVPTDTLDNVLERYAPEKIDFLKIDVEGVESEVLASIDLETRRPRILVVESVEPGSNISTHHHWQEGLTSRRYRFVYFDGLNRFFLAEESSELEKAFYAPPNFFDDYVRDRYWSWEQRMWVLESELASQRMMSHQIRSELNRVYASRSWRWSLLLRLVADIPNRLARPNTFPNTLRGALRSTLKWSAKNISRTLGYLPGIRVLAVRILERSPGLKARVRRILYDDSAVFPSYKARPRSSEDLSETGRHVFEQLKVRSHDKRN